MSAADHREFHLKTTTEPLPVKLTEAETLQRGVELAEAQQLLNKLADRKKAAVADIKAEEERTRERIQQLSQIIKDREELRPVPVDHYLDLDANIVRERRTDSLKLVRERVAQADERQEAIDFEKQPRA